ncbi:MAG: phosphatase [Opitutaceae bacterium]|nr:phosphatase [Opitutaceae bacterium]
MSPRSVAVIDIGSNSIKLIVAHRTPDGNVAPLAVRSLDARISAGISAAEPRLSDDGIRRGLDAIHSLLETAAPFAPARTLLVATSAVRDARNGAAFREHVREATGHDLRILTGDEEANLIGRGLTTDPALRSLRDFYVFDLGGGSLECLAFRERRIEQATSLKLGCVRLTERFVADPTLPLPATAREAIAAHTRDVVLHSGFTFSLPADAVAVGTGGTVTTARTILAAHAGKSFAETPALVTLEDLRELLRWLGGKTLEERKLVTGLPPARADIFPTAVATLVALAELGRFSGFVNSVHNLRYGLADEVL